MRILRLAPALLAAMLIAGCGESNPTEPVVDVDAALSQMASGGISTWSTAAIGSTAAGVTVPVPAGSASGCSYNTQTTFFNCAPITSNGVTLTRSFQLLDASGAALTTHSPLAVASIRSVIDLEGTITPQGSNPMTIEIDRHEEATLSGIQSANRVLNGTATQELTLTGSNVAFTSNDVSTTTNLQLPSTAAQKYPLGGTIVTEGTITTSGAATSTTTHKREISFDGTSVMTVKLTVGTSATVTCKIDLAAQGAAPVCT